MFDALRKTRTISCRAILPVYNFIAIPTDKIRIPADMSIRLQESEALLFDLVQGKFKLTFGILFSNYSISSKTRVEIHHKISIALTPPTDFI